MTKLFGLAITAALATCALTACTTRVSVLDPRDLAGAPADSDLGSGADLSGGGGMNGCTDVPSTQTVTFAVLNNTAVDRYLVTGGSFCDPFSVDHNGIVVPLQLGFQCLCECPGIPSPAAVVFHLLKPGEKYNVTWDARSLVTCSKARDCGQGFVVQELTGGHQPVAAQNYNVTFGVELTLPSGCNPGSSPGDYVCTPMASMGPPAASVQSLCPAFSNTAEAVFLPTSGDITVNVPLCRQVGQSCFAQGDCCTGMPCAGPQGSSACQLGP